MNRTLTLLPAVLAAAVLSSFYGCLTFHKVSYDVTLVSPNEGSVVVTAYDLRSTAKTKTEFEQDKSNLFDYMLKSSEFLKDQKEQGKDIVARKLFLENGMLVGQGEYKFTDVSKVEGLRYDGGFHYLNLNLDDSVISTNGEIIRSKDFKRIVWDSTFKDLKFTMLGNPFTDKSKFKSLAPYFNQKKKK